MTRRYLPLALAASIAALASPASAQERDAQVLRPGELRISASAGYRSYDARFTDSGTKPLGAPAAGPLTPETFAPLSTYASRLTAVFAETSGAPGAGSADPSELFGGDLGLEVVRTSRVVPIRVAAGVLPRVELAVSLPVHLDERLLRRLDLAGGNIGLNPDRAGNAAILGRISEAAGELGGATILPLDGSALGDELQRRALALTGEALVLPDAPLDGVDALAAFGTLPSARFQTAWQPGDLEIEARLQLLGSLGGAPFPAIDDGRTHHRLTAFAAARLLTGRRSPPDFGFEPTPGVGFGGASAGAVGDLFLGPRYWISGGGSIAVLRPAEVERFVPGADGYFGPGAGVTTTRRSPGAAIDLWVLPRIRLRPSISVGGLLRTERWLEGSDDTEGLEATIPGASRHSAGLSLRFTTLPVSPEGGYEIAAGYLASIAGSGGAPSGGSAFFQVSLRHRLFGGAQ